MPKNIFVIALDDLNLGLLRTVRGADEYNFVGLLDYDEVVGAERFPMGELLAKAERQLDAFPSRVDAIVAYWDFPAICMLPLLRRRVGLPSPSLESVLKCEHKYWSRLEQRKVVPELVPRFCAFDPFDGEALTKIDLEFPFWIKPVKSHSSHLGFKIHNVREFRRSIRTIRANIGRLAEPFNYVLGRATLPPEIAAVDGHHCIAEEIISAGQQCTLEGYVFAGEPEVYGIVDSVREGKHRSSFARYQYPSRLPRRVQERMSAAARCIMKHLDYADAPFNMEFYWNARTDTIALLEINARISKSHCPLFWMVDGRSHQEVMIDVALGRRPAFPRRQGEHRLAAKFMLRRYEDGVVTRVPDDDDIRRVRARFRDTLVRLMVARDTRLAHLSFQDSYSFEVAEIFMGADSQQQLLADYRRCLEMLDLRFAPLSTAAA
ncbi:MAG: ATP-grasp domain-containing protein [Gammaproteobacteria bacterium]|nr:ATP-grasp domain-containing protein [Gammaproteobacteria bacterium]NIR83978.1 ATP-grasp domain-containing protein [Gammaproteobacteria bacterium]NIR89122.1 ATP-grasp domain-containing protein [Gammaproteobacteria bacterium]NIU04924.1 ATP-grasp domain-containing protein [Gammaproteobacteria bacterium]NIV52090.1 ATP-grasp domain-containing protein [Gammaproteobacteria bacterium]